MVNKYTVGRKRIQIRTHGIATISKCHLRLQTYIIFVNIPVFSEMSIFVFVQNTNFSYITGSSYEKKMTFYLLQKHINQSITVFFNQHQRSDYIRIYTTCHNHNTK